jgi:hypothetical protein
VARAAKPLIIPVRAVFVGAQDQSGTIRLWLDASCQNSVTDSLLPHSSPSLDMTPIERRASVSLAGIFALRMLGLFLVLP